MLAAQDPAAQALARRQAPGERRERAVTWRSATRRAADWLAQRCTARRLQPWNGCSGGCAACSLLSAARRARAQAERRLASANGEDDSMDDEDEEGGKAAALGALAARVAICAGDHHFLGLQP